VSNLVLFINLTWDGTIVDRFETSTAVPITIQDTTAVAGTPHLRRA
jgi:hypothetical protein